MSTPDPALLTSTQLADLIEKRLGERPSRSMLYKAETHRDMTPNARLRITAGMPAPLQADGLSRTVRVWDRAAVEAWLSDHPRLQRQRVRDQLAASWHEEGSRAGHVRAAKDAGLSWAEIAEVVGQAEGLPITRQAVHARFRDLI